MKNSSHRGAEALRTGASQQDAPDWHRVLCVMVVVDMVESVRLMSEDEEGTVLRW